MSDRTPAPRAAGIRGQLDRAEAAALARGESASPTPVQPAEAPEVARAAIAAAPLMPRGEVQRATGTFRDPHKIVDWPAVVKAAVLAAPPAPVGPVVGVIVYANCAVVGPFESATEARGWWDVKYNRMRRMPFAIWPAPAAPTSEPDRAVVAHGWHSEEAGRNVLARLRATEVVGRGDARPTAPDPVPYRDRHTIGWRCPVCRQKWSGARDGHDCPGATS